jgi:hypothetical protein
VDIPQEAQLTIALGLGAVLQSIARVIAARAHRRWSMRPPREEPERDPDLISFSSVELEAYARKIRADERERLKRSGRLPPAWTPDDEQH